MKKNNYILIASSFIVLFAFFVIGIMYLKDAGIGQSNYSFTVVFDNVQGLNDGDHVNMLGKRIGSVTKTKILKQRVAVELSIYDNFAFRIPIDSYIEVKSEGLLGSKYISIAPGKNGEKSIQPGDTVEGIREYDLSEITPGIVPMTQDLAAFARQLRSVLGEEQKQSIKEIIASIELLSNNFNNLIVGYKDIISKEEKKKINNSISNVEKASEVLLSQFEKISEISKKTDQISESLDAFDSSMKMLNTLLSSLNKGNGTLGRLVYDDKIHSNLDSLVYDLRSLVRDVNDNPLKFMKAYIRAQGL